MKVGRETIEAALLEEHSKAQSDWIRRLIAGKQKAFGVLWKIVQHGKSPLSQRASWTFSHCIEEKPSLLAPILEEAVEHLLERSPDQHPAVRRNLLRALCFASQPPEDAGHLFDRCLMWIGDPSQPAAIRVYAMEIAGRIAAPYPELRAEVIDTIESNRKDASNGYRSRARKVLAQLKADRS